MAKILFVWELGGGFGHLARIRPIALQLAERGYQLFAAMNDVTRSHRINRDIDMRILQARYETIGIFLLTRPITQ